MMGRGNLSAVVLRRRISREALQRSTEPESGCVLVSYERRDLDRHPGDGQDPVGRDCQTSFGVRLDDAVPMPYPVVGIEAARLNLTTTRVHHVLPALLGEVYRPRRGMQPPIDVALR